MGQGMADPTDIQQDLERFALRNTLRVPAPAERAYEVFTGRLADWWVMEYTWSGPEILAELGMEPRPGGMLYEVGPYGFRNDWGRVLTWDPPRRLVFTWQIGADRAPVPDPAQASEVEVLFTPAESGTLIEVTHRHFDRHGSAAEGYRQALTAGWHELLSRYATTLIHSPA
ncbi:SRPBCC family protein [Verrucosispora sp. WMMD703]|uniref:ATPase n=1 Tax=Micromonospora sediminimaris TaxID=547162 RepID=A0A9W5US34_9ACTN|nr:MULTISPECIES: SRPBCC family protein [Micromonospora]WFE45516.1 SRPBCC family protein [Verrucosispora sp. WMMD1129]GIJ34021.1 ATPase [Micromonospora sediminimaris]